MRKAVVTGGAGFIGSHITDALLARGWSVLVVDDYSTGRDENLAGARKTAGDRLSVHRGDIRSEGAHEAVVAFAPSAVFHTAAQANVRRSVKEPAFDADVNVVGTIMMLEAARLGETKVFVFSSTGGAIYGEQEKFPAPESHPSRPECQYGVSKRGAELYLEYYSRATDVRCVSLRYANVYGPRQNPKGEAGVVAIFTERLLRGEPLTVNGDGGQTRDFVHVADVVEANILAAEASTDERYSNYNVGCGREISVNDVVTALRAAWETDPPAGGSAQIAVTNGPALAGEQRRSVVDASKISRELGWKPSWQFTDGIGQTIRAYRDALGIRRVHQAGT